MERREQLCPATGTPCLLEKCKHCEVLGPKLLRLKNRDIKQKVWVCNRFDKEIKRTETSWEILYNR